MPRSNIEPRWYFLRKMAPGANLHAHLKIRWNIEEKQVEEDGGTRTEYEYDEEELDTQLPRNVSTVEDLKDYLNNHKNMLLQKAKQKHKEKPPELKPRTIEDMGINEIREKLEELE